MNPRAPLPPLPSLRNLRRRLAAALIGTPSARRLAILDRHPPPITSSCANEVVACRLPDGRRRRVFFKYQSAAQHQSFGHRGNVAYEAEVYRRVLHSYPGFRPHCLGTDTDPITGQSWLLLEFEDRATRVSDLRVRIASRQPAAMVQAARWLGQFHAAHASPASVRRLDFLIRYDAEYFRCWARRTLQFTTPLHQQFPWLPALCQRTDKWVNLLLNAPLTVIHGEFYHKNLLLRRGEIRVVDWESGALAAGEIDLATLTEGRWPAAVVRRCERAYQRARWPHGAPAQFRSRLDAAKIYLHFRWLGERPDWTLREKSRWRYEHLHRAATRLKLL